MMQWVCCESSFVCWLELFVSPHVLSLWETGACWDRLQSPETVNTIGSIWMERQMFPTDFATHTSSNEAVLVSFFGKGWVSSRPRIEHSVTQFLPLGSNTMVSPQDLPRWRRQSLWNSLENILHKLSCNQTMFYLPLTIATIYHLHLIFEGSRTEIQYLWENKGRDWEKCKWAPSK